VLPFDAASDPTCLKRFCREARAAARLHHTNIVPVFDVGEHQGVHYYAMQFIQGQGLDEVMKELRRLRLGKDDTPEPGDLTHDLASVLVTGQVGRADAEPEGTLTPAPKIDRPEALSTPLTDSATSATATAPFYRSVAQLGLQVAEALAYTHGEKVLHRDVKPSNLLLDLHGRIWVMDFGLAKQEGEDLTRAGDVVGTLRYMAPERFGGRSDARGDIYSLGLTLYELMTLQAAYDETDHGRLIRQITHSEPVAPRKLDRRVPRDLETVVLKAIAKEPGRRYQTAEALAEDLHRFLADRPVLARRTS
jgi:serine/threonine protein kinase